MPAACAGALSRVHPAPFLPGKALDFKGKALDSQLSTLLVVESDGTVSRMMKFLLGAGRLFSRRTMTAIALLLVGGWLEFYFLVGWDPFWHELHRWQTLLGAGGAIFFAAMTVAHLRNQIDTQKREIASAEARRKEANSRKLRSTRMHLVDALSGLHAYTDECQKYLFSIDDGSMPRSNPPRHPVEHIAVAKDAVEFVDSDTWDALKNLVIEYQVHNARLSDPTLSMSKANGIQAVFDLMVLRIHIDNLYPYAGEEVEVAPAEATITKSILKRKISFLCLDAPRDLTSSEETRLEELIDATNLEP